MIAYRYSHGQMLIDTKAFQVEISEYKSDHLAPYKSICRYVQRLQEHGGDVMLVKWNVSPHIGLC